MEQERAKKNAENTTNSVPIGFLCTVVFVVIAIFAKPFGEKYIYLCISMYSK